MANEQLECPMCGAKSFTIDPQDPSKGLCSAEGRTYSLRPPEADTKVTLIAAMIYDHETRAIVTHRTPFGRLSKDDQNVYREFAHKVIQRANEPPPIIITPAPAFTPPRY